MNENYLLFSIPSILGSIGITISVIYNLKTKELINNLLKDYIKKEYAVTQKDLLEHKIVCRDCNDKEYAPIHSVESLKDSIDRISDKMDSIMKFLMEK